LRAPPFASLPRTVAPLAPMVEEAEEDAAERTEQWIFKEEALAQARHGAHQRAVATLQQAATPPRGAAVEGERRLNLREAPKALGLEEGLRLVLFYAQRLPEVCDVCHAPAEVRWTAAVFYRRFFAVRSPMEYDPLLVLFTCIHLACKVEEVHDITLDRLLEASDMAAAGDGTLKAKVAGFELPLIEAIGFVLLVEPKPDTALPMLAEELRHLLKQGPARCRAPLLEEQLTADIAWGEVVARAAALTTDLSLRTDAVLRWPASVVIAAALGAALDAHFGTPASECGDAQGLSDILSSLLDANLETEPQREVLRSMVEGARLDLRRLATQGEITEDAVRETARRARRCHRAFERLREEDTERHEAHRKERKRRWSEMKSAARRQVPTPILHEMAELNRKAAALRMALAQPIATTEALEADSADGAEDMDEDDE